jgi:hypothetical protein
LIVATFASLALILVFGAEAGTPPGVLPGAELLENVQLTVMPAVDVTALLVEDQKRAVTDTPRPLRVGTSLPVSFTPEYSGTWETLADGSRLWRLRIVSPGALNLSLGLDRFDLPSGAALWVHDPDGGYVQGPYTSKNRNRVGGLWTAMVVGDELVVELHLPEGREPDIEITAVNHGYRPFGHGHSTQKADRERLPCQVNVVCPEGDPFRDQTRATVLFEIINSKGEIFNCTGTLVNNTAEDDTPYLLTAGHCAEDASTLRAYFNYQAPGCGDTDGGHTDQSISGATLVAEWGVADGSDFALFKLDHKPDASFHAYYAGWDARSLIPTGTSMIHHPNGGLKSISTDNDPPTVTSLLDDQELAGGKYFRIGSWDKGTDEHGSSGACTFDKTTGLCVGTLSGSHADCDNGQPAWLGRMFSHFTGAGTQDKRLSDWLDPLGKGVHHLPGKNPGTTATSHSWVIPAVASLDGSGGSHWKSQIAVVNPGSNSRSVSVHFVPNGHNWPGSRIGGPHTIGPNQSLYLDDPLLHSNPTAGLMYVTADGPEPAVFSRTYNLGSGGATFAQGTPGIPLENAKSASASELILPLIHSQPGRFRTNVGFAQASGGSFKVKVEAYSAAGALLAEKTYTVHTAWQQVNDIFKSLGIRDAHVEGGWIRVSLVEGSPSFWTTYATVIDNHTNDPTYILPEANQPTDVTEAWLIAAVASQKGANNSNWKSEIAVVNPGTQTVGVTLFFSTAGDGALEPLGSTHEVKPKHSLYLADPLAAKGETAGQVFVAVHDAGVAVFARTYNLADDGSTFGQGAAGILLAEHERTPNEYVLPLTHSAPGRFRTNVGFAQTSTADFEVELAIYSAAGAQLAKKRFTINSRWKQLNDIFKKMGIGQQNVEGGWIRVTRTKGAPAFWTTYATVIDAQTNDPTYVSPVRR